MRAAFVVQRYGAEVGGGAEHLCRQVAERMQKHWDIEVLTTCAVDYLTWEDFYPPGSVELGGVTLQRFRVDQPRCPALFEGLSRAVYSEKTSPQLEQRWLAEQGPVSSELLRFLEVHADRYDLFLFFTWLYWPTVFGLPKVAQRSMLIPMAHDEPALHLAVYEELFRQPRALLFNSPEERDLVLGKFGASVPHDVVGVGIDDAGPVDAESFRRRYRRRLTGRFLLYLGRIDSAKGCAELFDFFLRYKQERPGSDLQLALAGRKAMHLPDHPDVVHLGFISEREKKEALAGAELLVMPSLYESLSLVTLEAWSVATPVLANGRCPVLNGQVCRSSGGWTYTDYASFRSALEAALDDASLCRRRGEQGRAYVQSNYDWQKIEAAYLRWGARVARGARRTFPTVPHAQPSGSPPGSFEPTSGSGDAAPRTVSRPGRRPGAPRRTVLVFLMDHPGAIEEALPLLRSLLAADLSVTVVSYSSAKYFPIDELLLSGANYLVLSDTRDFSSVPRLSWDQYRRLCGDDIDFFACQGQLYATLDRPLGRDDLFKDSPGMQRFYGIAYRVESVIQASQPDYVIVQQGSHLIAKIAYAKSVTHGVPTLLWETPFFPGKVLLDSRGMHFFKGENKIDHDWPSLSRQPLTDEQREHLYRYLDAWKSGRRSKYLQLTDETEQAQLVEFLRGAKKVLFFPGQVPGDANIVTGLETFDSYECILSFVQTMLPDDWVVVHKIHPKEPQPTTTTGAISHNCFVVSHVDIHALLERCDAVLVHSSNVGLEALIYEKPVICCGQPCYAGKGITLDLKDRNDFAATLESLRTWTLDLSLRDRFLHYVVFSYLMDAGDREALQRRLNDAADHCEGLGGGMAPFTSSYPRRCREYAQLSSRYNELAAENFSHREVVEQLRQGRNELAANPTVLDGTTLGAEALRSGERQVGERLEEIAGDHRLRYSLSRALLSRFARDELRILDFACGVGYGCHVLGQIDGARVTGVDGSSEAIAFARRHWSSANVDYVRASGGSFRGLPQSYDAIVSFETVEHMADDRRFLAKMWRLLRPGGLLMLSVPHARGYPLADHPFHVRHYSETQLRELLNCLEGAAGLRIAGQVGETILPGAQGRFLVALVPKGGAQLILEVDRWLHELLPYDTIAESMHVSRHRDSALDLFLSERKLRLAQHPTP